MYNVVVYGKDIKINGNHGTAGQVLTSDGVEGMSWTDVSGGGGSIPTLQQVLDVSNVSINTPILLKDVYGDTLTLGTSNIDFGTQGQFSCKVAVDTGLTVKSHNTENVSSYGSDTINMNWENNNTVVLSSVAYNQGNAGLFLTKASTGLGSYYTDSGVQLGVYPDTNVYSSKLTKDYLKVDKIKDASSNYGTLGQILSSDASGNIKWATGASPSTPSLQQVLDVSNNTTTGIYMNGAGIYDSDSHILPGEFKISYTGDVGDSGSITINEGGFTILNADGTGTVINQQNAGSNIIINQYDGITNNTSYMNPFSFSVNDGIVGSSLTKIDLTTPNLRATTITDMNDSIGKDGQYLVSTGAGLEWSNQLVSNTPIIVPASYAVYNTSQPPTAFNPVAFGSTPIDGWFFQNYRTGINIDWHSYLLNAITSPSISYSSNSIKQMYVCFTSLLTTCSISLNVYTLNDTPNPPNFFKSRFGTVLGEPSYSIVANKPYIAYYDFSGNTYPPPQKFLHTPFPLVKTVGGGVQVGNFYGETLYYMAVGSNTIDPADTCSMIISESGFIMEDGTTQPFRQPYLYQSASIQPLYPYSVQQVLTGNTVAFTTLNIGYTFVASTYTSALTITTTLSSSVIQNGVFTVYNSRVASVTPPLPAVNIVITYNGSSTYTLLAGKAVSFVWVGGTTNLLQLQ